MLQIRYKLVLYLHLVRGFSVASIIDIELRYKSDERITISYDISFEDSAFG